jgi:hypothetical protein
VAVGDFLEGVDSLSDLKGSSSPPPPPHFKITPPREPPGSQVPLVYYPAASGGGGGVVGLPLAIQLSSNTQRMLPSCTVETLRLRRRSNLRT